MTQLLVLAILSCFFGSIRAACVNCAGGQSYCYDDDCVLLFNPECPEKMGMNLQLYTRKNQADGQGVPITKDSIPSQYNGKVMTMYIIHGWLENENAPWMHRMKDEFLKKGDYNVIIVGWAGGAANLIYPQAASDSRTVGGYVGQLNQKLIKDGGSSRALQYCLGYCIGAHACGYAGRAGAFGRITGLSPVGPGFEILSKNCGLTPASADFVDAIHTDSYVFGTLNQVGHVNIYPNGGLLQPGCIDKTLTSLAGLKSLNQSEPVLVTVFDATLFCSLIRAYELYTVSINNPCFPIYSTCTSNLLMPLSCTKSIQVVQSLGFNSDTYSARGLFYLMTTGTSPYCPN